MPDLERGIPEFAATSGTAEAAHSQSQDTRRHARVSVATVVTWLSGLETVYKVIAVLVVLGGGFVAYAKNVKSMPATVEQLPAKLDVLQVQHDSQTAIMRRQEKLLHCVFLGIVDRPHALERCTLGYP